jgi:sensor histidine kinase YesM
MKRIAIFGVHLSYWTIYFLFTALFFLILSSTGNTPETQKASGRIFQLFWVANVIPSLIGYYIFHYLVFYKIKKSMIWYKIVLLSIGYCILIGILSTIIFRFTNVYKFNINHSFETKLILFYISITSSVALIHGILGLFMRAFFDWFNLRKEKEQLTEQNHQIELALVTAQLNPHFLFNSLNNIDILIHKDQEKASNYLNKLSDILRYMLFDAKAEFMPFDTELHFIEKYVALHKLRAANSDYVKLTNELENTHGQVASLVFIPFIENAFKYSSTYKEGNAVQIAFTYHEKKLSFVCKNRITQTNEPFTNSNGLGNELLKKRLDLIYKENYTLDIQEENGYFCVALTIQYEAN